MQNNDSSPEPDEARPITRHEVAMNFAKAATKKYAQENPPGPRPDSSARATTLLFDLEANTPEWPYHRQHIILAMLAGMQQQEDDRIVRTLAEENRPALLQRKGYEHVRAVVMVETPSGLRPVAIGQTVGEEKRAETKRIKRRLTTYQRPRVSAEKLKELEVTVAQHEKYDRNVIRQTAGDKQMTLDLAMDKHLAKLDSPKAKSNRSRAKRAAQAPRKKGEKGELPPTKNQ